MVNGLFAVSDYVQPKPVIYGCPGQIRVKVLTDRVMPKSCFDAPLDGGRPAVETLGVDLEQHLSRVTGPPTGLGSRDRVA
jgi:hypothetical protein